MASPLWPKTCVQPVGERSRLDHLRFCSPFAAALIDRHPDWLDQLQASGRLDEESPPDSRRAGEWVASYGLDDGLRAFRNQELLRVVWRDLNGLASLGDVLEDLTTLAEICLALALDSHHAALTEQYGAPVDVDGEPQAPVVIGLGKLGGSELNLSSDIDILFCYPAAGRCDGPRGLSNDEYFARLARAVVATLGEIRPTGFCFRVDTRLRPFGQSGPIACSFASLEQYYQREGRNWERYALVKARPVAGDRAAGEALIGALRPFVYRRYIDFGAIESLREMQALIRSQTSRDELRNDIKRGPGGIREVEFLAQGFQLLRGGREPRLQTPRLGSAMAAIAELGLLPGDVVDRLGECYTWLRHAENRLQAMHDQQTHELPRGDELQRLLRGMGLDDRPALDSALGNVRDFVSRVFDRTWSGPEGQSQSEAREPGLEAWRHKWQQLREQPADAAAAAEPGPATRLDSFVASLSRRPAGQQASRRLDRFMPLLLRRIDKGDLAEETIDRLLDLVLTITHRSAYLALLTENPGALDRTVALFGRSRWVADRVARFPELLDELIDPALGHHIPDRDALEQSVGRTLAQADEEAVLAGLNYLKQAACLRLAVASIEARLEACAVQAWLTDLAEVMVTATLRMAQAELERRHGPIPGAGVAVIAYGSLGARELGFDSDLDLVFLYREGEGESTGSRPLAAERWFARLAQRMVALLSALTPSGRLYEIDTRLRPNGQSGLLVSSIGAFETYQRDKAWTWEAQALTRARDVAGDAAIREAFGRIRRETLCQPRPRAELAHDLREMRQRIRATHGSGTEPGLAVKHGPGGLVDIGFIAQLGVLSMAAGAPSVAEPTGAAEQIDRLREAGWLGDRNHGMLLSRLDELRAFRIGHELDVSRPDCLPGADDARGEAVAELLDTLTAG